MSAERLSYWDYVRAAFSHKVPLPGLGPMPVNQMGLFAVALLGLVNPGFWFLGAAAELGYVGFLSASERFQRLVQGERLLARQQGWEDKLQRAVLALSGDLRERYRALLLQCSLILGVSPALENEGGGLRDVRAGSLNQLLWLFVRLLASRETTSSTLAQTDRPALEADIVRLDLRLAQLPPDSPLAHTVQATLDIQKKRLENLARAQESLEVVDAELERIEQQVRLIREEAAVAGGADRVSARLDAVSTTLSETSRWMDQHAEILGALAADDAEVGTATLPRLPEPPAKPPIPPPPRPRQKGTA